MTQNFKSIVFANLELSQALLLAILKAELCHFKGHSSFRTYPKNSLKTI